MVSFVNLHVGASIEVLTSTGQLSRGKVKWKGNMSGRKGEWIGVELFYPEGNHDGMANSRRYFQCKRNHGLFVRPWQIRFLRKNISIRSRDAYRRSSDESFPDASLCRRSRYGTESEFDHDQMRPLFLPSYAVEEILQTIQDYSTADDYQKRFHLSHEVGGRLKPAKKDQPKGGLSSRPDSANAITKLQRSDPSYHYYRHTDHCNNSKIVFRSPPSIPSFNRTQGSHISRSVTHNTRLNKTF